MPEKDALRLVDNQIRAVILLVPLTRSLKREKPAPFSPGKKVLFQKEGRHFE
jgi:hypothetical protein